MTKTNMAGIVKNAQTNIRGFEGEYIVQLFSYTNVKVSVNDVARCATFAEAQFISRAITCTLLALDAAHKNQD